LLGLAERQRKRLEHRQQMGTTALLMPQHRLVAAVLVLHTKTVKAAVVEVVAVLKPG